MADRKVVAFAVVMICSLSMLATCSSDGGSKGDGGGGHAGAAAGAGGVGGGGGVAGGGGGSGGAGGSGTAGTTGGAGFDAAVSEVGVGACAGSHCGDLCNSCPPSTPLCPGAIAYCSADGACVIGGPPTCP